jgi:hypothetical protein
MATELPERNIDGRAASVRTIGVEALAGRRWRLNQARARRERQPVLAAFALALVGHAALMALWWRETPFQGLRTRVLPAITVQLYEPETAPEVVVIDPVQPESTPTPPTRATVVRRQLLPEPPTAAALPEEVTEDQRTSITIDWPSAISDGLPSHSPAAPSSPLKPAPLPQLPGTDSRAWSNPLPSLQQRARQVGGAMSSAPVAGGGQLNKLVAPSYGEYMMDSDLVDKQSECHPTADGRLYCPERTRSQVVSGDW